MRVLAIVLIVLGVVALVYGGLTMTTREELVDLGPVEVVREEEHTVPLPPILGGVLLVAGVVLLLRGNPRGVR